MIPVLVFCLVLTVLTMLASFAAQLYEVTLLLFFGCLILAVAILGNIDMNSEISIERYAEIHRLCEENNLQILYVNAMSDGKINGLEYDNIRIACNREKEKNIESSLELQKQELLKKAQSSLKKENNNHVNN